MKEECNFQLVVPSLRSAIVESGFYADLVSAKVNRQEVNDHGRRIDREEDGSFVVEPVWLVRVAAKLLPECFRLYTVSLLGKV